MSDVHLAAEKLISLASDWAAYCKAKPRFEPLFSIGTAIEQLLERLTSLQSSLDLTQAALGVANETIASLNRENAALKREHDELRHAIRSTARLIAAARSLDDAFAEFGPDPELIHEHATELCAAIEAYDESMATALRPAPAPAEQAPTTTDADDLRGQIAQLRRALTRCRPQWIHSFNARTCLEALGELPSKDEQPTQTKGSAP